MFTETRLKGAFIIELERREDERAFYEPRSLPNPECGACISSFRRLRKPSLISPFAADRELASAAWAAWAATVRLAPVHWRNDKQT